LHKQKELGQNLVEFGIILGLVSLLLVSTIQFLGDKLKESYSGFTTRLENANQRSESAW